MTANDETEVKVTSEQNGTISYRRLHENPTISVGSSIVLSNCSSDEEIDRHTLPLKWKRQKILSTECNNPDGLPNSSDVLNNLHPDRNFLMSTKENVAASLDDELQSLPSRRLPPIPEDKLHRRNPQTVRRELQMFDDFAPETELVDIHLNEMPGLQNTEQWKRIAGRTVHSSPPFSLQYCQTLGLQDGQLPQSLGSYRRPGRAVNESNVPSNNPVTWRLPRRRILLGSFIAVVIVAIVVSVVLAITIVRTSGTATTEYYEGSVYVRAKFDNLLLDSSSPLARSYKQEFCLLIGATLADTATKYATYYTTCTVTTFHNGSIIADFVLGFTRDQNVTRLSSYLNHTLVNKQLFGGLISWISFNLTTINPNDNNTNSTTDGGVTDPNSSTNSNKLIMTEPNSTNEVQQQQPAHTSYTSVTYRTLETGLSITISETITITNNNLDKSPINNKNYELILIPTIENTKNVVVPTSGGSDTNDKPLLSPPATTVNFLPTKSSSQLNIIRPIRSTADTNFAYIDASSDDHTYDSGDVLSTLGDLTTQDSTTTVSTVSLNDETLADSTSTLPDNIASSAPSRPPSNRPMSSNRPPAKPSNESSEERRSHSSRLNSNTVKRQRRMIVSKNQRRLLQYELMPTGKVYYVDRPFYHENKTFQDDNDEHSSAILSTILSRSSSVDTLSDKRQRHHQHHRKHYHDLSLKKPEKKVSVGGRLASNNNLPSTPTTTVSSFKPVNSNKKNRFSSFEPTKESLDRVFDVLVAADKRREEHDFWREKFEHRTLNARPLSVNGRARDTINTNTVPFPRSKQPQLTSNSILNNADGRSQSYTNKRTSLYDAIHRQSGCLLEDCLRRRTQIVRQQPPLERNYSPNTIYSTNYPRHQLPPTGKPPPPTITTTTAATTTTTTAQQPVRILPLPSGRMGRAPQARQTSDELSSTSDVWAARSPVDDETRHIRRPLNQTRFPSAVNRSRTNEQKLLNNKRALSAGQSKSNRPQTKTLPTTNPKSKFFDLFKFSR